jgi:glyceraldehyde-3-phosphate dehydrogenase (NAD(P)+) (phosphorylating)
VNVAVVGMGVIGKRLARAIPAQPGLTLAGVAVRSAGAGVLARPELPYYAATPAAAGLLRSAGIEPAGAVADLLARADLVVDAGPRGTGAGRYDGYRRAGLVSVFCGGETDPRLGPLVHPALNPFRIRGHRSLRVPSCNTTALARLVAAAGTGDVGTVRATVLSCVTDTDKAGKGITNGTTFDIRTTHHGEDLESLAPGVRAAVRSAGVPSVCGHLALVQLGLRRPVAAAVAGRIGRAPRISSLAADTRHSTAEMKAAAYRRRPYGDRYDLAVAAQVDDPVTVTAWISLDNEAITVPETIDVIRGCAGVPADRARELTDAALLRPSTSTAKMRESGVA